jgi:hypothetical protein
MATIKLDSGIIVQLGCLLVLPNIPFTANNAKFLDDLNIFLLKLLQWNDKAAR